MLKNLLFGCLAVSVVLFSGCSSHKIGTPVNMGPVEKGSQEIVWLIGEKNDSGNSMSRASDAEESGYFTLQRIAEVALEKDERFFAINAPKSLSNYDGSTISTMEEFTEKCTSSTLGGFGSAFDAFGLNSYACNLSGTRMVHHGYAEVVFFKTQPDHVLTWDAKAVIDYLKKEDLYKEYEIADVKVMPSTKTGKWVYWLKTYRNKI